MRAERQDGARASAAAGALARDERDACGKVLGANVGASVADPAAKQICKSLNAHAAECPSCLYRCTYANPKQTNGCRLTCVCSEAAVDKGCPLKAAAS